MLKPKKKPAPTFVVRLTGRPDLQPWNVPPRYRSRLEEAIMSLITHKDLPDASEDDEDLDDAALAPETESPIYLLDSRKGSVNNFYAATDGTAALKTLREYGDNLKNPTRASWDAISLSATRKISRAADAMGCSVEIHECPTQNVIAKITPSSYEEISQSAFVTGSSAVYGYLQRVGGATAPRCALRVARQERMVYCALKDKGMAAALGQHVYQTIRVFGQVTWFRRSRQVKTIQIEQFWPTKQGSIHEALEAIWEAGGKAWDKVDDVEATIAGMR